MKVIPAIFIFSVAILLIACDKGKYETKPRLEIIEYNTKFVDIGQNLLIRLNYYDKEGDLSGGPMIGIRERLNIFPPTPVKDLVDTFRVTLPEFPKEEKGEISFELPHDRLNESAVENDTIIFRFAVTDAAGNKSDTITSEKIVVQFKP
jgi:hypothetical protein